MGSTTCLYHKRSNTGQGACVLPGKKFSHSSPSNANSRAAMRLNSKQKWCQKIQSIKNFFLINRQMIKLLPCETFKFSCLQGKFLSCCPQQPRCNWNFTLLITVYSNYTRHLVPPHSNWYFAVHASPTVFYKTDSFLHYFCYLLVG